MTTFFVRLQHTETMRLTDVVTDLAQRFQCVRVLPQLLSVFKANGIDYEMRMNVSRITMRCNKNFMTGPGLRSKFLRDLMCLLWCDVFSGMKRLHVLIEVDAVCFAVSSFRSKELCDGITAIAVDSADEFLL